MRTGVGRAHAQLQPTHTLTHQVTGVHDQVRAPSGFATRRGRLGQLTCDIRHLDPIKRRSSVVQRSLGHGTPLDLYTI